MIEKLKTQIKALYDKVFFEDNFANSETGIVNGTNRKIATYPYIGDKYGKSTKILVVGLDIGEDETLGEIQSLADRNDSLKRVHGRMNFHMGGTYFTALYLLKDKLGYSDFYNKIKSETIFNTIIKRYLNELPTENPLDYIAQTNFYKYVKIGRVGRKGDFDRVFIDSNREISLFISEVNLLNPEIIFFQSTEFNYIIKNYNLIEELKNNGRKIFIAYHPSKALPKLKYPEYYFKDYCKEV